jgi:hypothetical protein
MAAKKILTFFCAAALAAGALRAQDSWRDEASQILSKTKDYKAVAELVGARFDGLPAEEKADAAGLLAFCFRKTGDPTAEMGWVVQYFDGQNAKDTGFAYLDLASQLDVLGFLNEWKASFPWITSIALIRGIGDEVIIPQGILPLVVEIQNRAYYKFSEGSNVIKGGEFLPGFNVIGLDANLLFSHSGRRSYLLEIKSGPLILKRQIDLDVSVTWPAPPAAAAPAPPQDVAAGEVPPGRTREYRLEMYVGGDLVMASEKTETVRPLFLGIPRSNNPAFLKPDYYVKRGDPWTNPSFNSFSIFDALGLLYKALKDLWSKRKGRDVEAPKIQTAQDLSLRFRNHDASGYPWEMKVDLNLFTKNLPYAYRN